MMINYILALPYINAIGGGQLYGLRRIKYLKKEKNVKILILTSKYIKEDLILKEFIDFDIIVCPDIFNYGIFNKKEVDRVIEKIYKKISFGNEIVLESCYAHKIMEKIAEELKARHYIYFISEKSKFSKEEKDFFLKKYTRKEFISVSKETYKIIFDEAHNMENHYVNIGYDENEISSNILKVKELNLSKNKNNIRIITISRLEKTYIKKLIEAVEKIVENFTEKKIELIIVGDSYDNTIKEELKNRYLINKNNNLNIRFLGYINPLFSELYTNSDLFVGTGTSLINAVSYGLISIVIDTRTDVAAGFFGKDVENFGYIENNISFDIYSQLELFLKMDLEEKEKLKLKTLNIYEKEFKFKSCMKKLDTYVFNFNTKKGYIETNDTFINIIKFILYKYKLLNILKKVKKIWRKYEQ